MNIIEYLTCFFYVKYRNKFIYFYVNTTATSPATEKLKVFVY